MAARRLDQYEALGLRRWAHMLGFRGHFLIKSRRYWVTVTDLLNHAARGA